MLYAPGDWQDYSTSPLAGRWRLLWVHFTPKAHWQPWLRWPPDERGLRLLHLEDGEARACFRAALERVLAFSRRDLPGALDLAGKALEEALLWARAAASRDPWLALDPRVRKAADHLVANLREPFSLADLARRAGFRCHGSKRSFFTGSLI